jgi:hypothetical protein
MIHFSNDSDYPVVLTPRDERPHRPTQQKHQVSYNQVKWPNGLTNDLMVWLVTRWLIASIRSITDPSYKTMVESIFLGAICLFLSFATFFCSKQRKKIISFNFLSFLQSFLRNKHSVNLSFPQSFLQLSLLPGLGYWLAFSI